MQTLTLNNTAAQLVGANPKVRVRQVAGNVLQIRPTIRSTPTPLPAGEKLFEVKTGKLPNGTYCKFDIDGALSEVLDSTAQYTMVTGKRGWFTLLPTGSVEGDAGGVVKVKTVAVAPVIETPAA